MINNIKLPPQEWLGYDPERGDIHGYSFEQMREFAELIVKECISTIENAENGYQDYRNQIENGMRKHCIWLIKDKFGVE